MAVRLRRALVAVLLALAFLGLASTSASALPDLPDLPDVPGIDLPSPSDVCNNTDAPVPASPYGDGSWIVRMSPGAEALIHGGHTVDGQRVATLKDPFTDAGVSLESTYGTTPQWWTYDNGCGGRWLAAAGTAIGNTALQLTGMLPNWTESLITAVIDPSGWTKVLDEPVSKATDAVAEGVWGPWLPIALVLAALLIMMRSRAGQFAGVINAAGWALGVLVVVSWLVQYPVESVRMVDAGVRTAVVNIAVGFNGADTGDTSEEAATGASATVAVDRQMDQIVRSTQYRTWLDGVFGDADSDSAQKYGARIFRATHFSWAEYDTYTGDPSGKGKKILEAKQSDFKAVADELKDQDPVAYSYFKGDHWGQRLSLVIVNGLVLVSVCLFLIVSALAILMAFVLVRFLVPFAPAAGVIYMVESTRELALGTLKKVVGPLVMGPVLFAVGLILLRFDSFVLTADLWFPVKLALVALAAAAAWKLTRPTAYSLRVPGLRRASGAVTGYVAARAGAHAGADAAYDEQHRAPAVSEDGAARRRAMSVFQPVGDAVEPLPALAAPAAHAALPTRSGPIDDGDWIDGRSGASVLAAHTPVYAGGAMPEDLADISGRDDFAPAYDDGAVREVGVTRSAAHPAPAEANVSTAPDGGQVFVIYTPEGTRNIGLDDDWWGTDGERSA
jgi:hypothetical protein